VADFDLLGGAGASVCLCPTTERDLADGVGPAARLAEAGASLCLGSDSNAVIDPLEEARAMEMDERLVGGERGNHHPAGLMRAATSSGHASIGWPEAGRIEPGAIADLVTVGLDSARLAGTVAADALASVIFAGGSCDVRSVLCGGRQIVLDGRHVSIDVAGELKRAIGGMAG
jgi:cytosine/adenosine deaminase-related metal-dependent hydrolase